MIFTKLLKNKLCQNIIISNLYSTELKLVSNTLHRFCTKKQGKPSPQENEQQIQKDLIESELQDQTNLTTMKKNYEEVEVESFKGKAFSNLTQLQRKIIQEGKFDLAHPEIKPKLASINSIPGLQTTEQITQIQLGNIKIKQKNQVFLSQVDPYNIPQDYEIRFDEEKKLTIVGKRVEKTKRGEKAETDLANNPQSTQMPISLAESFEQKSLGQISEKYMGQIGYKYQFNRKRSFKQLLLAIPVIILLVEPIVSTIDEVYECLKSIQQIEEEQMKEITKLKRASMVKALLNNKDFNQII